MNYCKACGKTMRKTVLHCPHCGAAPRVVKIVALDTYSHWPIWTSITGLMFGLLLLVSMLAPDAWNREQAKGKAVFAIAALVSGSLNLAKHHRGSGMAVAPLVLGVIGLSLAIDSPNEATTFGL